MLAAVLDGHAASGLPRTLVREQRLASSVGASYDMSGRGASLFTVIATPAEGKTTAQLEAALRSQVGKLARRCQRSRAGAGAHPAESRAGL